MNPAHYVKGLLDISPSKMILVLATRFVMGVVLAVGGGEWDKTFL